MSQAELRRAPSRAPRTGSPLRRLGLAVGVAFLSIVVVVQIDRLVARPAYVERVTFENPTAYDLTVDVTGADHDGWLAVCTARRGTTATARRVIDQGDTWIFRFGAQGREGGELRVARRELERTGWKIAIPEAVGERLREQGAPLPP